MLMQLEWVIVGLYNSGLVNKQQQYTVTVQFKYYCTVKYYTCQKHVAKAEKENSTSFT